jgi:ubiquinone biosynthesis protein
MFRSIRNTGYILKVLRVLGKHDALFFADDLKLSAPVTAFCKFITTKRPARPGECLANALYELGPTYIKLGQALSIRADIVGESIADDLEHMQDRLPPFCTELAQKTIETELEKPLDELFATFETEPVAAASIAQVHFATMHDGKEVAVKILRPDIEEKFEKDIDFLRWTANVITRALPKYNRLKLGEVVEQFARTTEIEMDLRLEAAAACELAENFNDDDDFYVPAIEWDLTSERVLTLERVSGIRIDNQKALYEAGLDPQDILEKASRIFFMQVYRDGYFHADQHPGNMFISPKGQIIAIDFGIMGRIDLQSRIFLARMLQAFINKDYKKVADIHFDAGYVPANQDRDLFCQAIRAIGEPIHGKPQDEISVARMLRQMFKVTADFEMETQPQLLLLQKTMMLAEGLGRKLNPKANFWMISKPLVEQWAIENLGPKAQAKMAADEVKKIATRLNHIIKVADTLPQIINEHGITLSPRTIDALARRRSKKMDYAKIIILSSAVSALTVWLVQ